jgi:hypothetical protein
MKYTVLEVKTKDGSEWTGYKWLACEGEFNGSKRYAQADTAQAALDLLLRE